MKTRLLFLAFGMAFICSAMTSCQQSSVAPPEQEATYDSEQETHIVEDDLVDDEVKTLIKEYLKTTGPYKRTYFAGEADEPQEDDRRIDVITCAGEETTCETSGVAFLVECSYYNTWHPDDPAPSWRTEQSGIYIILGRDADGQYYEVRGTRRSDENVSVNQIIQEISYDLIDLEVSLWRDGCPAPVGPGSEISFFRDADDGPPKVEVLEGWEPIYGPGAYWSRQSWDGFSALCYHAGENLEKTDPDAYIVYAIDTTRTDMKTYRGIRVGATRTEVLEAYPDIYDTNYWNDTELEFPGGDYLWYCDNEEGWGAAILFFFDGDTVSQIRLNNMFN